MRKTVTAALTAATIAVPVADVAAAAAAKASPKKKVVTTTKQVVGPTVQVSEWGPLEITLVVKKTTTTIGKKTTVARKIVDVGFPIYPNHTNRSVFINQQALPMLRQEVLVAQMNANVNMISGASDTSDAFVQSLQAALVQAQQV